MFQFNIVFEILIAYLSNYLIGKHLSGDVAWRWMLGVEAFPIIFYTALCFEISESPRWLIGKKAAYQQGIEVLKSIQPTATPEELQQHANEIAASFSPKKVTSHFWSRKLSLPIMLAFLIAFFNQLSGINAILYFAPRIFKMTGLDNEAALLQSVGIGVTNLIFTFIGLWLIDRLGRRSLLYIGSIGYILSLGLVAWSFFTQHFALVPIYIFALIAAHAVGQGAVICVFISEIFPNRYRAAGTSLGAATHWIFAALVATFFPKVVTAFPPGYVFLFFCGMMVLQLILVKTMVIETKGIPLEEIQKKLGINE